MAVKILGFIFTFAFLLFTLPVPVLAQAATPSSNLQLPTSVSPTSPIYTDLLVHNMFHTFSCLAVGQSVIGQPCLNYVQGVPVLSQVNLQGGTLGAVTGVIGLMYQNPPVRTYESLAGLGQTLGIVKEAKAQVGGSGAGVLQPIQTLWQVSRNISYVIMIIIFVVIGLMVMFRQRINPQTVITAQAAIPGLVIGLILITFSYFLAGLISDTAFIGVNLVGHYFSAALPGSSPRLVPNIASENVGSISSKFVGMISIGDISGVIDSVMGSLEAGVQFWVRLLAGIIGFQTGASVGGPIGSIAGTGICASVGGILAAFCAPLTTLAGQITGGAILGGLAFGAPGATFGFVLYFVAIAAVIYTMFRLLLRLITSYLTIIFLVISAPFQFLFSSLPGRQGIATDWILNLLANVLAFPAVFAVFYFVAYLWGPNTAPGNFFGITDQLSTTDNQTLPLLGGMSLSFIRTLLGFGAILATPTIPEIVIRSISKVSQAGQLIGQEIGAGTRAAQGYAGRVGAVPGQIGRGLAPLQQLGASYETVIDPRTGDPMILYKPSIIGRLRHERAETRPV